MSNNIILKYENSPSQTNKKGHNLLKILIPTLFPSVLWRC